MNKEQEAIELLEKITDESLEGCTLCVTKNKIINQAIALLKQPSHRRLGSMTMYPKPADSPPTSKKKTAPIIKPETGVKKDEVASQPPVISMKVAVDDCDILDKPPMREFTKELRALLDIPDDDSCKDESYRKDLENLVRLTCDRVDKVEAEIGVWEKQKCGGGFDGEGVTCDDRHADIGHYVTHYKRAKRIIKQQAEQIKELEAQIGEYSRKEK